MRVFYLKWVFILTGGKLFMDYILPFNESSKVALWRNMCRFLGISYGIKKKGIASRMGTAIIFAFFLFGYNYYLMKKYETFDGVNIIGYVYPFIIQIYVGLRCHWILQNRRNHESKVLHGDQ